MNNSKRRRENKVEQLKRDKEIKDMMKEVEFQKNEIKHLLKEIEDFKRKQIDFDKNADTLNALYEQHIIGINGNPIVRESIDHLDNNEEINYFILQ